MAKLGERQLHETFIRWARGRGVKMAEGLAKEIRSVLSVQAPTRVTRSGRVVATTKAVPFAPPRRVSGDLQRSVRVDRMWYGARVVIGKSYGFILEKSHKWPGWPHEFLKVALQRLGLKGKHS